MIVGRISRISLAALVWMGFMSLGQMASGYTAGACRIDGEKFCPGITTDKELIPCLKQHQEELSMDCKVNLAEARQMVRDTKDACQPDIQKYCANVQTGQGRIRRCLKTHESELSSACQAQIATVRKKYHVSAPAPESK